MNVKAVMPQQWVVKQVNTARVNTQLPLVPKRVVVANTVKQLPSVTMLANAARQVVLLLLAHMQVSAAKDNIA
jgi:hypothetical protein